MTEDVDLTRPRLLKRVVELLDSAGTQCWEESDEEGHHPALSALALGLDLARDQTVALLAVVDPRATTAPEATARPANIPEAVERSRGVAWLLTACEEQLARLAQAAISNREPFAEAVSRLHIDLCDLLREIRAVGHRV